jgi:uncharacterized protein
VRVWIDLANSPHPLLFAPIARRLEELGHEVCVTARDHAQTLELARERWPDVERIGGPSPRGRRAKAAAIGARMLSLRRWAGATQPEVALSHNSYAQLVAARSLRIPAVTAMDYEHQPASHVAFRAANWILLPATLPLKSVKRQGASERKVVRYNGLKEELYVGDFEPDGNILARLGIERRENEALVVMRAPPAGAMYHRSDNPLLREVVERLGRLPSVRCVVLARQPEQRSALSDVLPANCHIPEKAVDSRSLMYAADLVIGAGGTMTREAALLGIPTISIYAGRPPFVEVWLERQGLLRRAHDVNEIEPVDRRASEPRSLQELRRRSAELVDVFVSATVEAGQRRTIA